MGPVDPALYRPKTAEVPTKPGVYRFVDGQNQVIYVGKAKNLRQRLSSYFADPAGLHPRTYHMVHAAHRVIWTVVASEVEALQLEYMWIKEHAPRFNVKYRDDKSYPYLAVTLGEEFPRVQVLRGEKRRGVKYFGPYTHAWAIRETVDLLLRVFPIRTCSAGVFRRAQKSGRACLLGYIDKCSAPCVGKVTPAEHRAHADGLVAFMAGRTRGVLADLTAQMKAAAQTQDYEAAARRRDDVAALERVLEQNSVVLPDETDADLFALATDSLDASVYGFHVRGGRIRGQRGWVIERTGGESPEELMQRLIGQFYSEIEGSNAIPPEVLVSCAPEDHDDVAEWLARRRGAAVSIRVPQRGDKKDLMATVGENAQAALARHKTRRSADLASRSAALTELQQQLGLAQAPLRIEAFDISTLHGTHTVGSMVVFEDGLPRKSDYRTFTVSQDAAGDDLSAMREVVHRRFRRYLDDRSVSIAAPCVPGVLADSGGGPTATESKPDAGSTESPTMEEPPESVAPMEPVVLVDEEPASPKVRNSFAYPPQLVLIDGGAPQVAAASTALAELGVTDVAVAGLAKRLEEVWLPGEEYATILPRDSEALYVLQAVRDEAHRFAVKHHRSKRSKAMTHSALDGIKGLGPKRITALLEEFGSTAAMVQAGPERVAQVKGIGPAMAEQVVTALARELPEGINMATGEIVDR